MEGERYENGIFVDRFGHRYPKEGEPLRVPDVVAYFRLGCARFTEENDVDGFRDFLSDFDMTDDEADRIADGFSEAITSGDYEKADAIASQYDYEASLLHAVASGIVESLTDYENVTPADDNPFIGYRTMASDGHIRPMTFAEWRKSETKNDDE